MNTSQSTPNRGQQLLHQITQRIEELAQATDKARMSEEMTRYLDAIARFHQYSVLNTWLIFLACPQATVVAGFHAWHKFNRFVRKGECGIPILAPIITKERDGDDPAQKVLRGFKVVYVFDMTQTDGEPLPEPPDWKSPEKNAVLAERLIAFAKERGIAVTEKVLPSDIQGVSKGGAIELLPTAGTSTLLHELAHELMHKGPLAPLDRRIRELEAEAVAYAVGSHFGLASTGSPNYVALHGATSDNVLQHLDRVRQVAACLIQYIESQAAQPLAQEQQQLSHAYCAP